MVNDNRVFTYRVILLIFSFWVCWLLLFLLLVRFFSLVLLLLLGCLWFLSGIVLKILVKKWLRLIEGIRRLMMRVKSRVEILEDEIGSLDDRVKVLETLNKELKSKYADNIVQIELLVQSMDDFERAMLKVIFSPFDSTGYRHGVGGWCKP